jgi:HEAT repeat protein
MLRREEEARTRADILGRLAAENSPALTPLFIERLAEDEAEVVRRAAVNGLIRLRDEPGVSNALDRAAVEDPSPAIRRMITVSRGFQN